MIIDCHGHYTTAPAPLWEWRKRQVAGQEPGPLRIPDDEISPSSRRARAPWSTTWATRA
jgi:4-oxalmesaconate hydratase